MIWPTEEEKYVHRVRILCKKFDYKVSDDPVLVNGRNTWEGDQPKKVVVCNKCRYLINENGLMPKGFHYTVLPLHPFSTSNGRQDVKNLEINMCHHRVCACASRSSSAICALIIHSLGDAQLSECSSYKEGDRTG